MGFQHRGHRGKNTESTEKKEREAKCLRKTVKELGGAEDEPEEFRVEEEDGGRDDPGQGDDEA